MTVTLPLANDTVGQIGVFGYYAANTVMTLELELYPSAFFA